MRTARYALGAKLLLPMLGLVWLGAIAWAGTDRPVEPQYADGVILGRDFTRLLANPSVTMTVEREDGAVVLRFSSTNSARLDEVLELGEHMRDSKRLLEGSYPDRELQPSDRARTARNGE